MNLHVSNYNSEQVHGILFLLLFVCIVFHFLGAARKNFSGKSHIESRFVLNYYLES